MTLSRGSYPDVSSRAMDSAYGPPDGPPDRIQGAVTAAAPAGGTLARQLTEPLRELSVFALLAGNAVFLLLGFSGLILVIDRWASDFGLRCAQVFSTFVGPTSLGLPIAALLLATHVAPMVQRARLVGIVVLSELGVSVVFGALTFLGAFANDLSSPRATVEGTLWRIVWLGLLILACLVAVRLWLGLYPAARPSPAGYGPHAEPAYGRPYPGQPLYPQQAPGYPGSPSPALAEPTQITGWPLVPPPPLPEPLVVPFAEPTVRVSPETIEISGDLTQLVASQADLTQKLPSQADLTQKLPSPADLTQKLPSQADLAQSRDLTQFVVAPAEIPRQKVPEADDAPQPATDVPTSPSG